MKNLDLLNFKGQNVLSRTQMKSVFGGNEELAKACPEGSFECTCTSDEGTTSGCATSISDCWDNC